MEIKELSKTPQVPQPHQAGIATPLGVITLDPEQPSAIRLTTAEGSWPIWSQKFTVKRLRELARWLVQDNLWNQPTQQALEIAERHAALPIFQDLLALAIAQTARSPKGLQEALSNVFGKASDNLSRGVSHVEGKEELRHGNPSEFLSAIKAVESELAELREAHPTPLRQLAAQLAPHSRSSWARSHLETLVWDQQNSQNSQELMVQLLSWQGYRSFKLGKLASEQRRKARKTLTMLLSGQSYVGRANAYDGERLLEALMLAHAPAIEMARTPAKRWMTKSGASHTRILKSRTPGLSKSVRQSLMSDSRETRNRRITIWQIARRELGEQGARELFPNLELPKADMRDLPVTLRMLRAAFDLEALGRGNLDGLVYVCQDIMRLLEEHTQSLNSGEKLNYELLCRTISDSGRLIGDLNQIHDQLSAASPRTVNRENNYPLAILETPQLLAAAGLLHKGDEAVARIQWITSRSDLVSLGNYHGHCVGSYAGSARNGSSFICTLRRLPGEQFGQREGEPDLCIELRPDAEGSWKIWQSNGHRNRMMTDAEFEMVCAWAKLHGFSINETIRTKLSYTRDSETAREPAKATLPAGQYRFEQVEYHQASWEDEIGQQEDINKEEEALRVRSVHRVQALNARLQDELEAMRREVSAQLGQEVDIETLWGTTGQGLRPILESGLKSMSISSTRFEELAPHGLADSQFYEFEDGMVIAHWNKALNGTRVVYRREAWRLAVSRQGVIILHPYGRKSIDGACFIEFDSRSGKLYGAPLGDNAGMPLDQETTRKVADFLGLIGDRPKESSLNSLVAERSKRDLGMVTRLGLQSKSPWAIRQVQNLYAGESTPQYTTWNIRHVGEIAMLSPMQLAAMLPELGPIFQATCQEAWEQELRNINFQMKHQEKISAWAQMLLEEAKNLLEEAESQGQALPPERRNARPSPIDQPHQHAEGYLDDASILF